MGQGPHLQLELLLSTSEVLAATPQLLPTLPSGCPSLTSALLSVPPAQRPRLTPGGVVSTSSHSRVGRTTAYGPTDSEKLHVLERSRWAWFDPHLPLSLGLTSDSLSSPVK